MRSNIVISAIVVLAVILGTASCEKDFDSPPRRDIPVGFLLDIADLNQIVADSGAYSFDDEYSIYGTVTADGSSGNFFRQVFVQNDSMAMSVRTVQPDGLYEGDYIRINLNGATVTLDNGVVQIEDVNIDERVVIQANNQFVEPIELTMEEALSSEEYLGFLIRIVEAEVIDAEIGLPYANSNAGTGNEPITENRNLQDCDGNQIILRNSGYSSFADDIMPTGKGSATGIYGKFGDDRQLFIRDTDDLAFSGLRCNGSSGIVLYQETFDDYAPNQLLNDTEDWSTFKTVNDNVDWDIFQNDFVSAAKVTSFNGSSGELAETWLVSQSFDLSGQSTASLAFLNTKRYNGPDMKTFISTDYTDGSEPGTATWEELPFDYDTDTNSWDLVSTNLVSLADYLGTNVHIAFVYIGANGDTSTWEIDNVTIYE